MTNDDNGKGEEKALQLFTPTQMNIKHKNLELLDKEHKARDTLKDSLVPLGHIKNPKQLTYSNTQSKKEVIL